MTTPILQNGYYIAKLKGNTLFDNEGNKAFIHGKDYRFCIKNNRLFLQIGENEKKEPLWNYITGTSLLEEFDIVKMVAIE